MRLASPAFLPEVGGVVERLSVGEAPGVERRVPVAAVGLPELRLPEPGVAVAARVRNGGEHGVARQAAPRPHLRLHRDLVGRVARLDELDRRAGFDHDPELEVQVLDDELPQESPVAPVLLAQPDVLVRECVVLLGEIGPPVHTAEPADEEKGHRLTDREPVPEVASATHRCTLSPNALVGWKLVQ